MISPMQENYARFGFFLILFLSFITKQTEEQPHTDSQLSQEQTGQKAFQPHRQLNAIFGAWSSRMSCILAIHPTGEQ